MFGRYDSVLRELFKELKELFKELRELFQEIKVSPNA